MNSIKAGNTTFKTNETIRAWQKRFITKLRRLGFTGSDDWLSKKVGHRELFVDFGNILYDDNEKKVPRYYLACFNLLDHGHGGGFSVDSPDEAEGALAEYLRYLRSPID